MTTTATSEALVNGALSFSDRGDLVRKALRARLLHTGVDYCWVWVVDMTATDVVYETEGDQLWQCGYSIDDDGTVVLADPVQVARTYVVVGTPAEDTSVDLSAAVESAQPGERDHLVGRVLESKGTSSITGGRVYAVRIISVGDSLNGNRYGESVLAAAAGLYEGAKAYNRHRSTEEISSGTIEGLVGLYRNVTASREGLDAELHLFPSATSTAEALDAALAAEAEGLPPTVGISHDVLGSFSSTTESGRQIRVAQSITHVFSADVVSEPAAGGKATRVVAGGIHLDLTATRAAENQQETPMSVSTEAVLAALKDAKPDQLASVGLQRAGETTAKPEAEPARAPEATTPAEPLHSKNGWAVRGMVQHYVTQASLPAQVVESVLDALPEQVTESQVNAQLRVVQDGLAVVERAGLAPRTAETQVTKDERDRKREAIGQMLVNNGQGYGSLREAFIDWSGERPRAFDEDFNRRVLAECFLIRDPRARESLDSGSWAQVFSDELGKRLVAEYDTPELQSWRQVVSSTPRINDFREQKISRVGGYGQLPEVAEGAPYQPLTSPGDEDARYSITKRGGTEDLTLEMIANDDLRAVANIPKMLGRAAAITLYRFVWDIFPTNGTVTYDSKALFHADHSNTTASALSYSSLTTLRGKMRKQARFGSSIDVLSLVPKFLIVPTDLEDMANRLCTSEKAQPAASDASDMPNLHRGLTPIVIDYWSDANDWFLLANPMLCPTIEVGFYQGKEQPELFSQIDNNVGSVFDADKITWKIRHIYGSVVVDHRGMQRGTA
jgi:hypothetical protein